MPMRLNVRLRARLRQMAYGLGTVSAVAFRVVAEVVPLWPKSCVCSRSRETSVELSRVRLRLFDRGVAFVAEVVRLRSNSHEFGKADRSRSRAFVAEVVRLRSNSHEFARPTELSRVRLQNH